MSVLKKSGLLLVMLGLLLGQMLPVQAAMVSNTELVQQMERGELVEMLQRAEVQQQLIELGVDPAASLARVNQMSDQEVAELNGQIRELPVGAGLSTVDLLLIIIIILLLA